MVSGTPDLFAAMADDFAVWAKETADAAAGDPDGVRLVLELMRDYLGIADPRDLGPGDLRTLLLSVFPRKITVFDREGVFEATQDVHDLLRFMAETGQVSSVARLERELSEILPDFPDAMMNPANWGMARSFMQEMDSDGVDINDQGAVDQWIASYNSRSQRHLLGDPDLFSDGGDLLDSDSHATVREAYGLPDRLPALRLPGQAELASAARESRLLSRVRALAVWADGRELTPDGDLVPADLAAAAGLLEIDVPPGAATIDDVPELLQIWHLACCALFVCNDGDRAEVDETVDEWPGGDEDEVMDAWAAAFGHLIGHSLPIDGQDDDLAMDLGLVAAPASLAIALFLARDQGIPLGGCRSLMNELATAGLAPADVAKTLAAWTRAHGELADILLDRLSQLGAVETEGEAVRLTPLALWQVYQELSGSVEIPLLPLPEEMTAAELVDFGTDASEDELARELGEWLAVRPATDAARELLVVATQAGPALRMMSTSLATAIGVVAEPAWREVLGDPALSAYAKLALNQIAGRDPAVDPLPGLRIELGEVASMLGDTLVAMSEAIDGKEIAEMLSRAVPPGEEERLFELMWRSPNLAARQSLELLGRHHPDKKIAKAARKAAFKARSRAS